MLTTIAHAGTIIGVPFVVAAGAFAVAAFKTFGVNQEYERAVLFRLGRLGEAKGRAGIGWSRSSIGW